MKTTTFSWPMLSRIVAAILGGYAFTYAFTAALARLLPLDKVDALISASLLSFAVYTAFILWAFACRSAARVWAGLALAVPLAVIGFWPQLMETLR
ncbi:iron transporter [Pseudomonas huaxiensis]|uniref:iron transporter n=1 Tax=Pseudomonas huaxiensis TaxID=2213017 RepID=UPI000DA648DC|nr:iron transporter [Pseudomonas huaxiensis]